MNTDVINRIRQVQSELGFNSDAKFSEHIGITRSNFSQMMQGKRPIGDAILNKICIQTKTSKSWLLTGEGQMKKDLAIELLLPPVEDESYFIGEKDFCRYAAISIGR